MKYVCVMFPYPSAASLHAGHYYNYAVIDSYCRWLRSKGEEVFQPFGYDAFGLPAEQYAIKMGKDPRDFTQENIGKFRNQMVQMNTEFEEMFSTTDPEYIDKTQWIFNIMMERGLAYKAKAEVDWCPKCDTTLAKEQVASGSCERCNTKPEKKELEQWYFKITEYRDRLIANIDGLDWPDSTKRAQKNWLTNQHDWCVSRQRSWGCPIPLEGETDTLDTFVDSSFYFIEYCIKKGIKPKPVDIYVGGSEHACMHLIYARFVTMVLFDAGYIDFEEPFKKLVHQGMILNNGEKMSKSKGNAITLDEYNPDVIRFYLMFIGHYFDGGSWSDKAIIGVERFIHRFSEWTSRTNGTNEIDLAKFFDQIDRYTESFKFNKVVSEFMTLYKNNKHLDLTVEQNTMLVNKLRIYMPGFKNEKGDI